MRDFLVHILSHFIYNYNLLNNIDIRELYLVGNLYHVDYVDKTWLLNASNTFLLKASKVSGT